MWHIDLHNTAPKIRFFADQNSEGIFAKLVQSLQALPRRWCKAFRRSPRAGAKPLGAPPVEHWYKAIRRSPGI
jgi:hypothetical protein